MKRDELDDVAGDDGRRGVACDPRVRVGVAERGLPVVRDIAVQAGLEAANPIAARHEEKSGIVRIGERHVGALEVVHRRGDRAASE